MINTLFGAVAVFLIWLGIVLPIFGWHYETGRGSQVGYVSAIEKSGVFFKTGTVYIKPELESTQEDDYCVVDDMLYLELGEMARNKQRVEVSHFSWLSSGVANCNAEGAVIYEVKSI